MVNIKLLQFSRFTFCVLAVMFLWLLFQDTPASFTASQAVKINAGLTIGAGLSIFAVVVITWVIKQVK